MIKGEQAKAAAIGILGEPLGKMVASVDVRPATDAEKSRYGHGLTVGDVWTFELEGPKAMLRQFVVTSK